MNDEQKFYQGDFLKNLQALHQMCTKSIKRTPSSNADRKAIRRLEKRFESLAQSILSLKNEMTRRKHPLRFTLENCWEALHANKMRNIKGKTQNSKTRVDFSLSFLPDTSPAQAMVFHVAHALYSTEKMSRNPNQDEILKRIHWLFKKNNLSPLDAQASAHLDQLTKNARDELSRLRRLPHKHMSKS